MKVALTLVLLLRNVLLAGEKLTAVDDIFVPRVKEKSAGVTTNPVDEDLAVGNEDNAYVNILEPDRDDKYKADVLYMNFGLLLKEIVRQQAVVTDFLPAIIHTGAVDDSPDDETKLQ